MPNAILLEKHNAGLWRADLVVELKRSGYEPYFDGEDGNTLFLRVGDEEESAR